MQNPIALPNHYGPISGHKDPELIFVPLNPGVFSLPSPPPPAFVFFFPISSKDASSYGIHFNT